MSKTLKRIPLSSLDLEDLSTTPDPENPDTPDQSLPTLSPLFSISPTGETTAPSVDFAFPADDYRRVLAWFTGDFSHVTLPESATLKKNMTAAVKDALDSYISAAYAKNLFISPFMIGWRYRLFDGSIVSPDQPMLISPAEDVLRLIINSYNIYEKALHTAVTFSLSPVRLLFSLPAPANAEAFLDIITDVEFYICRPADIYPDDFSVSGIRSVTVEGVRERVWYYSANDVEGMKASVSADSNYRLIATIPFSEIATGQYASPSPLPIEAGALTKFTSLPKLSASSVSASGGFTGTDGWRPYLHVQTPPLDLSLPETAKSVCDLYLRGLFQRDLVKMSLYGSHHRENWRLLARAKGPYIRGLRRTPYRWLRVEIELPMRRNDFLDALTFGFYRD